MGLIPWAEALGGKIRTWRLDGVLWDGFYKKEWLVGSHLSVGLPEAKLQICYLSFIIHCCIWRCKGTYINYIHHLNLEKQEAKNKIWIHKDSNNLEESKPDCFTWLEVIAQLKHVRRIWGKSGLRRFRS